MAEKPLEQEMATEDHGYAMTTAYTTMLIENPDTVLRNRGPSFAVYDELLRDDQVKACFQQRRSGLTSASWHVDPATESPEDIAAAEFLHEQIERVGWDDVCDKMLYGVFYGFAVSEIMWEMTEQAKVGIAKIKVRDRARFSYNTDDQLMLMDNISHPMGLVMPEEKFWSYSAGANHDDNPYGQGLAHSLYWPVFFKRNDIKFWLIFLEKFGMPTTAIRMPEGQMANPQQISKAKQALAAIQADSGVVIPDGMVIELIEAARSGTADYDGLVERMDKAISKVILSQTMTTDDGSSRAQAQVHFGVGQAVIDSDADLIADSFRRGPATWLTNWNFPNAGVPRITRDTKPEMDLSERAERDSKIFTLGYEPTQEYIEETYGTGWERKAAVPVPSALMTDGQGPMPAEFAELNALLQGRLDHRSDQEKIAAAAELFGTKYQAMYGKQVERIQEYLEDSGDFETFKRHMTTMMAEVAPAESVQAIQNATVVGRLMGMLRGQRN